MRELHGVVFAGYGFSRGNLKRQALLFDRFIALGLEEFLDGKHGSYPQDFGADVEFLRSSNLLSEGPLTKVALNRIDPDARPALDFLTESNAPPPNAVITVDDAQLMISSSQIFLQDLSLRASVTTIHNDDIDSAPIYQNPLTQVFLTRTMGVGKIIPPLQNVLNVAMSALPAPDDLCSWQDILDFKADLRDKQWGFRRFLRNLATKQQTEAEIGDEIEWMVNEYTKAMEIHHIKASQSFVDVLVISPLEIIENLVKFNCSKIAKGALQVQKRKVELMEAELKAPGRECAYVFGARRRFGP